MRFMTANRTLAETGRGNFNNSSGASLTKNAPVCFVGVAASVDGHKATAGYGAAGDVFVGIAEDTTADRGIGSYQAYGYRASVAIYAHAASVTIAIGSKMGPGAVASLGLSSEAILGVDNGGVIALEAAGAAVCSPGGYIKGFIQSL